MNGGLERAGRFKEKRLRWSRTTGALRGEIPSPPRLAADPRVILLHPDVVLLADAKHAALLAPRPAAPAVAVDAGAGGSSGPSWIARLGMLGERGGGGVAGPGLLLQLVSLGRLVALPAGVPAPANVQITVSAAEPARLEAVLTFAGEAQAKAFVGVAPQYIERARQLRLVRFFNLSSLLEAIRLRRKSATVTTSVPVQGDQVRLLLETLRMAIPQVRVPGMPDRQPPDAGPPRRDAAHPDAGPRPAPDAQAGGATPSAQRKPVVGDAK
jgi:hypothetical protein